MTPTTRHLPRRSTVGPMVALLIVTVLSTSASAATPSEPPADDVVRWSVAPADDDGPDGRISLRHVLDPGDRVRDAVAVTNLGEHPAELTVVAGDGVVGDDGAFDVGLDAPEASGSWIRVEGLEGDTVVLAADETRVLPVTVDVPDHALPGDHPAGIVVGMTSVADGMTVVHRIGVRVHLQVTGELTPGLELRSLSSSYEPSWVPFAPGTLQVDYELANVGNVRLGAATAVAAAGPFGLLSTRTGDRVDELLPGGTRASSVTVRTWPLLAIFGDASVVVLPVADDQIVVPEGTERSFVVAAVPWTGLVVVVLAGATVVVIVRRRRSAAEADTSPRAIVAAPDIVGPDVVEGPAQPVERR